MKFSSRLVVATALLMPIAGCKSKPPLRNRLNESQFPPIMLCRALPPAILPGDQPFLSQVAEHFLDEERVAFRLSVHGLGHSPYGINPYLQGQAGLQGIGQQGFGQGMQGIGMQGINPFVSQQGINPFASQIGLQHTPFINPYTNPFIQNLVNPTQSLSSLGGFGQNLFGGGLTHSNAELRAQDPVRISQTFPYVFAPQSPVSW